MADLELGVIVRLEEGPGEAMGKVRDLGLVTCQVSCWTDGLFTPAGGRTLREIADRAGVRITAIWAGLPGRYVWNFIDGPSTIGLVPPGTRASRLAALLKGCDFARAAGVDTVVTHVGFIPEDPRDPLYAGLLKALHAVVDRCRSNGQTFCFETGQETPVTLLRTIQDLGVEHLGVNLDPANLLMYGKANPVDALDILGPYVRGVHAKDGDYPTDGRSLGPERPIGEGRVNFPALVPKLRSFGYSGALTMEREISGEQQRRDLLKAKAFLAALCRE